MDKNVIAIDLGATSGRVVYASYDGIKVSMETMHRFKTPLVEEDGRYFWDIHRILEEISIGLSMCKGKKVDSIGIDTWGVDFCKVLKDGSVCRPRAYRDPYTDGVPERFFKEMSRDELYSRTGIQIMNFNSVFQLYAQKAAGELEDAEKILLLPDALSYMLSGNMVCEYTMLSTTALMDPRTKDFDQAILKVIGIEKEMFADIVLPGTKLGYLKDSFGLGPIPVIAVAGHDTASAVYAVPSTEDAFAYLSSGTWSLMGIESPDPVINEKMAALNYTNEGGAKGNVRVLKNITGMWLLEQCLVKWRSEGKDYTYPQLTAMAVEAGKSPVLIDPDDPLFASPTDMPAAICSKLGKDIDDAAMVRLIYDSLAAKYAEVFHNLEDIAGHPLTQMNIIGGGCQNELLDQMTADACGVKVVAGPSECTALGNVMLQTGLSRSDILNSIETKTFYPNE